MARENPSWGEERIANELRLKLGLRVSARTIRKYLLNVPATPLGTPRRDQRWSTFLQNHAARRSWSVPGRTIEGRIAKFAFHSAANTDAA
jgi:hypothetical protein